MNEQRYPVLYSFRRCPYAIRTRMVLLACNQDVLLREVHLANKPEQMMEASSKGTVPVLCLDDGQIIDESLDIMQWAIDVSRDPERLYTKQNRQKQLELVERNDTEFKYWLDRYKYHVRYPEHPAETYRQCAERFLDTLDSQLKVSTYLFGPRPVMADIAIVPFVRQFSGVDREWIADDSAHCALKEWLKYWLEHPLFLSAMVKYPAWTSGDSGKAGDLGVVLNGSRLDRLAGSLFHAPV